MGLMGVVALVFALTVVLLALLLKTGWALRIAPDVPNHRSLHVKITPRVGGMVLLPVVLLVCWLFVPSIAPWAGLGMLLWLISILDDRYSMPTLPRFVVHLAVAAMAVYWLGLAWPWAIICCLLIGWFTNLYNFMDGADGLAGGMAVFGFGSYALATVGVPDTADLRLLTCALAFAGGGFLLFNFPPARIFMGDSGSVPLGFFAGALGVWGVADNAWPGWVPVLVFAPFVADATVTLLRRAARGDKFWQAHREHYYQRLVRMGWSHRKLACSEYGLMLSCGALALSLQHQSGLVQMLGLVLAALVLSGLMLAVDRRWAHYLSVQK